MKQYAMGKNWIECLTSFSDNSSSVEAAEDLCDAGSGKFCDWHQNTSGPLWVKHHGMADSFGNTGPTVDSSGSKTGEFI